MAQFGAGIIPKTGCKYVQYAGRKEMGDLDQLPLRMEREYRGPGYRAGRKNYEQDTNPMENEI